MRHQLEALRPTLTVLLASLCVACGGGDAGPAGDPAPRYALDWQGTALHAWQLQAGPAGHALAVMDASGVLLNAQMYADDAGQLQCALAMASTGFGDAQTLGDGDSALTLTLDVTRWDLGLGRFDTDLPLLAIVHHGQRAVFRLGGFNAMPGTATLAWQRASGWSWQLNGVPQTALPVLSADTGAPSLQLSIDGCSEAMQQTLHVDGVQLMLR